MRSEAKTVKEYLAGLPDDRRKEIERVRRVVKKHLPKGFEETMQYGMIGYVVPLNRYPEGYLDDPNVPLPFLSLASQKNYIALYALGLYSDKKLYAWFLKEWGKTGKKLDMGKSCIRFKKTEDVPLDLIGEMIAKMPMEDFIKLYEKFRGSRAKKKK